MGTRPGNRERVIGPAVASRQRSIQKSPSVAEAWLQKHGAALGIGLFLVAAELAVYGQTAGFGFVRYDDDIYVYDAYHVKTGLTPENAAWAFKRVHAGNWHPLTTLSHQLDCSLYGLWAGGHHLTNVLLHAAGSVVLFLVLRRLTGATWRSGLVAAFFCLHPLRVESVAWVAERKDVLSGLFFGLTLWAYAAYAEAAGSRRGTCAAGRGTRSRTRATFPWGRYALMLVLFALGLLCKPMLVTLPFVLLLLDYWPLGRFVRWTSESVPFGRLSCTRPDQIKTRSVSEAENRSLADASAYNGRLSALPALLLEKLPLLALSAASCMVTYSVQVSSEEVAGKTALLLRLQTAVVAYVRYLGMMVWPTGLAAPYPPESNINLSMTVACGIALLAITSAAAIGSKRYGQFVLVGWLWYLGMLVPVSGIITIGHQAMADRYTYLPMIGLYIAIVWLAAAAIPRRYARFAVVAAGAALAALAAGSIVQARHWRDSEALYRRALAATANNSAAHTNLAAVLLKEKGKNGEEEALWHLDEALRIDPDDYIVHNNIGLVYLNRKQWKPAADEFRKAIGIKRNYAPPYANLGLAQGKMGEPAAAEQSAQAALQLNPELAAAEDTLATALAAQGRFQEAIPHFRQAIRFDASQANWRFKLGMALLATGTIAEGLAECRRGLDMAPSDVHNHNEMALVYYRLGRLDDAAREWTEVLKRQPDHAEAAKGLKMLRRKT